MFRPRFKIAHLLLIFLAIFAASCSQQDNITAPALETNTAVVSRVKAGSFAPGQLEAHYLKHGYQFGNITQDEYLRDAQALLNATPGKDILEKTRPDGDILHYQVSTGEFAVMSRDGRIRTYFKTNYQYWMRQ